MVDAIRIPADAQKVDRVVDKVVDAEKELDVRNKHKGNLLWQQ